jgi:ABC-type microcin C transport system duplicated ATPase subunit YejF
MTDDLLIARDVEVSFGGGRSLFGLGKHPVKVLHGVTIRIGRGETVGIVGESGSGKTTLGRALLRLIDLESGTICFDGQDITNLREPTMRPIRRRMQLIFQDPMASLNPRRTIRRIMLEPMLFHRVAANEADAESRTRKIFARFSLPSACSSGILMSFPAGSDNVSASRASRYLRPISFSRTRSSPGSTSRRRPRS